MVCPARGRSPCVALQHLSEALSPRSGGTGPVRHEEATGRHQTRAVGGRGSEVAGLPPTTCDGACATRAARRLRCLRAAVQGLA
eukprot:gene16429-biopygen20282